MNDRISHRDSAGLTRRAAIQQALTCGLAAAALPASALGAAEVAPVGQCTFEPEDDYPFFGCEPKPSE